MGGRSAPAAACADVSRGRMGPALHRAVTGGQVPTVTTLRGVRSGGSRTVPQRRLEDDLALRCQGLAVDAGRLEVVLL